MLANEVRGLHGKDPSRLGKIVFVCLGDHLLRQLPVSTEFLKVLSIVIRFLVLVLGMFVAIAAGAKTITGRVVNVGDGDTVTIQDGANQRHTVRLSNIDAPDKVQSFGNHATSSLAAMVFDRAVIAQCAKRDRYGRDLCKILLDGRDINLEQVKAGMAWWDKQDAREQSPEDRSAYEQAQFWAQTHRLGLWTESRPVPPWEFRHER